MNGILEEKDRIKRNFIWLCANGYEKSVENFLYDVKVLMSENVFSGFNPSSDLWNERLDSAYSYLLSFNEIYSCNWGENICEMALDNSDNKRNIIRHITKCLLWEFVDYYDSDTPRKEEYRPDKNKIRFGFSFVLEKGKTREVENIVWYIKRIYSILLNNKYHLKHLRRNHFIEQICYSTSALKHIVYSETGEYCFRRLDVKNQVDKKTFVGEIVLALLWDEV